MPENRFIALRNFGQSIWIDFISRDALASGELARLVEEGVLGLTSNPAIFEQAISKGKTYDADITSMAAAGASVEEVYEALALADIRAAADMLRPVYDRTAALDGYVSLEVSPRLAHDTAGTIANGRRLWAAVERPNLMIKVPGTPAGIPAIRALIAAGINVNVTLLFARKAYEDAADAYIAGLEERSAAGLAVDRIGSVASFFVSRLDTVVDAWLSWIGQTLRGCAVRLGLLTPSWRTHVSSRSSLGRAGKSWRLSGQGCSARCGPAPARKTPATPTPSMWTSSSARIRSTRHRRKPSPPFAITAR